MPPHTTNGHDATRVGWRVLIGVVALAVLVVLTGLIAHLTRDGEKAPEPHSARESSAPSPTAPAGSPTADDPGLGVMPTPPSTNDPIAFGKAAAEALWSYDTRAYSQPDLLAALRTWLTGETEYADAASVEALIPSPELWGQMADNGQFATATVNEAHFPAAFTQAIQADPGAITQAYVYAVTVSGKQSIGWDGSPRGGAERRSMTLAIQCRPTRPCALIGVLPNVAP
jgi:hypothetical protein